MFLTECLSILSASEFVWNIITKHGTCHTGQRAGYLFIALWHGLYPENSLSFVSVQDCAQGHPLLFFHMDFFSQLLYHMVFLNKLWHPSSHSALTFFVKYQITNSEASIQSCLFDSWIALASSLAILCALRYLCVLVIPIHSAYWKPLKGVMSSHTPLINSIRVNSKWESM